MSATTVAMIAAAMCILALADFSIKESAGRISPSLGTLVYAVMTVAIPVAWTI